MEIESWYVLKLIFKSRHPQFVKIIIRFEVLYIIHFIYMYNLKGFTYRNSSSGRRFEPRLVPLSFLKFMRDI